MSPTDKTISALTSSVDAALERGNINSALRFVHDFVERIITEPLCTAKVFASLDLDQLCLRIGRHSLANLAVRQKDLSTDSQSCSTIVYLVSRLQRSGGHSRLVQDFIRAQPRKNHLILSTEVGGPSDIEFFSKLFAHVADVRFAQAPRGNFEARLRWLQSTLLSIRPEHVYLLNHHQDSVAVAALSPQLELAGTFCHHGDHHLCLGVHLSHLIHIDFHPMGYHYCRNELGLDNKYLPLTFEDKQYGDLHTSFMQGDRLTTATAARSNKVEIPYYASYIDIIPSLLKATGGRHVHIGKLTPWALWRIFRQMRKQDVQRDRFVYIEWTESVWKALQEYNVDIYISSFPYGAGLTLIEAMGAGIPVIMHEHMYSRVLSGLELAYPEAYRWSRPEKLFAHLLALQPEQLAHERNLARSRYLNYHHPEILRSYFTNSNSINLPVPPLLKEFKGRPDDWAAWAESQIGFARLFRRSAYRLWRTLRRWTS